MALPSIGLLDRSDPPPFSLIEGTDTRFVISCEHAGVCLPRSMHSMGIAATRFYSHIGWDVGALALALKLRELLQATLIYAHYSRLFIDLNRPWESPSLIPQVSDGTQIPFNHALTASHKQQRWDAIHLPYHRQLAQALQVRENAKLISIHSFTPQLATNSMPRPWQIGLLYGEDERLAHQCAKQIQRISPSLCLGMNQPYRVKAESDYTLPFHGIATGRENLCFEIRQDLLLTASAQLHFARIIKTSLEDL